MKIQVTSLSGKAGKDIELNDIVFGQEFRKDILSRVVEWQRASAQVGSHSTKERGEVHGTTKKPFAQKGTGNARQGSRKGPHMRGGGVAHGPRVRSHAYSLPKKIRQLGLKVALSLKLTEGKLTILDNAALKEAKTKTLAGHLDKLNISSALFIDGNEVDSNFRKAASNLKHIDILPQIGANVLDILKHDNLILTEKAVEELQQRLA